MTAKSAVLASPLYIVKNEVLVLVLVLACPVLVNITGIFITISQRNACVMVVLI